MDKITLESNATHFYCAGCDCIKPVKKGIYRARIAYGKKNRNHVVIDKLLCEKCYYGDEEKDEEKKCKEDVQKETRTCTCERMV
jgi:hypothetical protein